MFSNYLFYGSTEVQTTTLLIIGGTLALVSLPQALIVYVKREHFHNNLFDKILGLHAKKAPEEENKE